MANQKDYDVVVIGGGPGGYVAAIRASQLGMKAAVVEKEHLGGICLNWGCIPTKALLRAAELRHNLEHLSDYGIEVTGEVKVNLAKVVERSRGVANRLSGGVAHLLKKNKVDVIEGVAKLWRKSGAKRISLSQANQQRNHIKTCDHRNRCKSTSNSQYGSRWQANRHLS